MADNTTFARPYARAAFEAAQGEPGGLQRWSQTLGFAASVVQDATMQTLLADPEYDSHYKAGLLIDLSGERLDQSGRNFIKLLAENDRLSVLPDIQRVYEELRAEAEKTLEADMISAFAVSPEQRERITAALSRRLKRAVVLKCSVDEALVGGAIIRAGDLVIDGSARGKLAQLAQALRY